MKTFGIVLLILGGVGFLWSSQHRDRLPEYVAEARANHAKGFSLDGNAVDGSGAKAALVTQVRLVYPTSIVLLVLGAVLTVSGALQGAQGSKAPSGTSES